VVPRDDKPDTLLGGAFFRSNKMQKQNRAADSTKASREAATKPQALRRRSPQSAKAGALLVVTLNRRASKLVRRFAKQIGADPDDVASALLADSLPQCIDEFTTARGKRGQGQEWEIIESCVRETAAERNKRGHSPAPFAICLHPKAAALVQLVAYAFGADPKLSTDPGAIASGLLLGDLEGCCEQR